MAKRRSRRRASSSKRRGRGRRVLRWLAVGVAVGAVAYLVWLDIDLRRQFDGSRWSLPAHLYSRPIELRSDLVLTANRLAAALTDRGYRPADVLQRPGSFRVDAESVQVITRPFTYWDGHQPAVTATIHFEAGRIASVTESTHHRPILRLRIEPRLLGSFSPTRHEDRILVSLHQAPEELLTALLVMEDRRFMEHRGVDLRGVGRAVLANLRSGEVVQGGSTLTQQLVKNMYLGPERTVRRKALESIMALLLEAHYDKGQILEAYLNEVFLAQAGQRAIHGFGLASEYYFGRPLAELALHESALLVGMVKAPSVYEPRRHPQRALQRRNLVLEEMARLGHMDVRTAEQAQSHALGVADRPPAGRARSGFVELVRRQLQTEYRAADLRAAGMAIFTTLDPDLQQAAERALGDGLGKLERQHGHAPNTLEGAVVVTDVGTAEVLALVGGRHSGNTGFNRALDAVRPIGSLVKPAVYLTALQHPERYTLATIVRDEPLIVEQSGAPDWEPQNYDRAFRGDVSLLTALADSYNVPAVRLGLELGVSKVAGTLSTLGIRRALHSYPSLLLGAAEIPPFEVMQMYQTIAAGGVRRPLNAVLAAAGEDGLPVSRRQASSAGRVDPQAAYLLVFALQEVVRRGTAAALAQQFAGRLGLAGKTGTTNDYRDSWFAGFSGNYAAVVWVGQDDNRPVGLTGASGAMRIWADLMTQLDLAPVDLARPAEVSFVSIDPVVGLVAGSDCARAVDVPFVGDSVPRGISSCAGAGQPARRTATTVGEGSTRVGGWFRRLFRGDKNIAAKGESRDDREKRR